MTAPLLTRDDLRDWLVQQQMVASEQLKLVRKGLFHLTASNNYQPTKSRLHILQDAHTDLQTAIEVLQVVQRELDHIMANMESEEPWLKDAIEHGLDKPLLVPALEEE